nr:MarR-family transcriptional regulator [Streptomyces spiroverticillatus]
MDHAEFDVLSSYPSFPLLAAGGEGPDQRIPVLLSARIPLCRRRGDTGQVRENPGEFLDTDDVGAAAAGTLRRATLDARSDELAGSLLKPLNTAQRARLVAAMAEADRLLTAATVTLDDVDPDHPDAQRCLRSYYTELRERFESGFDPARSRLPDAGDLRPPRGLFLVARLHGDAVGCAGLKLPPGAPPEIKRMWVAPRTRRLGLGRRFLTELEARAARHGCEVLRLDTNKALTDAISLYHSCGYQEIPAFNDEPYAHHWFEKRITGPPSGCSFTTTRACSTAPATGRGANCGPP